MLPEIIYITPDVARKILKSKGPVKISLDLGISYITVDPAEIIEKVGRNNLEKIAKKENVVYMFDGEKLIRMHLYDPETGKYYKLVPTPDAPTIEISGLRMHRTVNATPWKDAEAKVRILGINGGIVLDTCTGLGYTAIHAARRANKVITVEIDKNVLEFAKLNPWSRELFERDNIEIIIGDVFEVVDRFPDNYFDYIIHDPPRPCMAPMLFSEEFYRKLYRVLKPGGKMYHYVGEPGKQRGLDIARGVIKRLQLAGFVNVKRVRELVGVYAEKRKC